VVAEQRLIRAAMSSLLLQDQAVDVVGSIGTIPEAVPTALALRSEVAVVDIDGANGDGIAVAEAIRRDAPHNAVLMLTGRPTPALVHRALGVPPQGLLAKDNSTEALLDGVHRLRRGEVVIEPDLAAVALPAQHNPLTRRERDVLRLAENGVPVREMATRLVLSAGTVRNYLSSAITKVRGPQPDRRDQASPRDRVDLTAGSADSAGSAGSAGSARSAGSCQRPTRLR
jgi:two-component system response regulator DesR